uniref:Reverse transcriptase zinc-binding domain-containing protein n=1 Tax=Cannabis sativa TaxID=3483 RepID=A0A803NL50_CANSA
MKNLLWRAAKCCLPTMSQLQLKRVEVDFLCLVCLLEAKTISHALLTCSAAILCWNRVGIGTIMQQDMSFLDWCIRQFLVLDVERTSLLVALCWAIGMQEMTRYGKTSNDLLFIGYIPGDGAEQWVAPSANSIEINVNATVFNETHNYGVGVVARDSNSLLVEGCTKLFQGSVDSMVAEAIGFGKP